MDKDFVGRILRDARVMQRHLRYIMGVVLTEDENYHLQEAEGNLGQFIEELEKTLWDE